MNAEDLKDAILVEDCGEAVVLGVRQRRLLYVEVMQPHQARVIAQDLLAAAKIAEARTVRRVVTT